MDAYDVIIIGTGAGGGTLARHLAPSGKRILLLERGDWLPREPQNWLAESVFMDNRYVSADTWYDGQGKPFQPQIHYWHNFATQVDHTFNMARRLWNRCDLLQPHDFPDFEYADSELLVGKLEREILSGSPVGVGRHRGFP